MVKVKWLPELNRQQHQGHLCLGAPGPPFKGQGPRLGLQIGWERATCKPLGWVLSAGQPCTPLPPLLYPSRLVTAEKVICQDPEDPEDPKWWLFGHNEEVKVPHKFCLHIIWP